MQLNDNFDQLFGNTTILGMIHMYGVNSKERVQRALDEIKIFEDVGIGGAIVENYNFNCDQNEMFKDITDVLISAQNFNLVLGLNLLGYESQSLSVASSYGAKFVQIEIGRAHV